MTKLRIHNNIRAVIVAQTVVLSVVGGEWRERESLSVLYLKNQGVTVTTTPLARSQRRSAITAVVTYDAAWCAR